MLATFANPVLNGAMAAPLFSNPSQMIITNGVQPTPRQVPIGYASQMYASQTEIALSQPLSSQAQSLTAGVRKLLFV